VKTAILLAAAEHSEHAVELPVSPYVYAGVAAAVFLLSLFVTMSWKGISYRH
jgi:hypothetical protein